jgi:hypothetical protein
VDDLTRAVTAGLFVCFVARTIMEPPTSEPSAMNCYNNVASEELSSTAPSRQYRSAQGERTALRV